MAGIYIHIPFCKQACHYCDFHFSTSLKQKESLLEALCAELAFRQTELAGQTIESIYFGGGTPSILTVSEISRLLHTVRQNYRLSKDIEITLEANPDDISAEALAGWKQAGINRLSIGIQSFDEDVLKWMNRVHQSKEAITSIKMARAAGFQNISIDLIYGLPHLTDTQWQQQLDFAFGLAVQHISAYCLTIEPQTVFGKRYEKGQLTPAPDDDAARQFMMLTQTAREQGWHHYEISNLCRPGFESGHNSAYWSGAAYIGAGPAAHSYNGSDLRRYNISHNIKYIKAWQDIGQQQTPPDWFTEEPLTQQDRINDYLLTTIRTSQGVDLQILENLGYHLIKEKSEELTVFEQQQISYINQNRLILTDKGRLLADAITAELMKDTNE